nr:hypothetical protein [Tanacetum cinerariifolium]
MALTFADTYNMIAFLTKSDASEGFEQIIDFLNTSVIHEELFAELARMGMMLLILQRMQMLLIKYLLNLPPPSPTPATTPPPQQEINHSPSQVASTPPPSPHQSPIAQPSSPPPQQPPSHDAEISMTLLNTLLETCATLTKQVANLKQDKIAQAIEITKLKQRVRRLEKKRKLKASGLKRLRKVETAQRVKSSANTVMDDQKDASKQGGNIVELDADEDVTLEEVDAEKDAEETDDAEPTEVEEVLEVVTAAKLMTEVVTTATTPITAAPVPKVSAPRRRKGVIIQDLEEAATASLSMQSKVKSKDKEAELNANINWNEVIEQVKRKERQDHKVMRYQALKRKHVTEVQSRKNMMVYLKNMAGFKMDFFKGMTYTDIRLMFEKHFNSIWAFMEKGKKEIEEEDGKRKSDNLEQQAAKKQKIDEEVPVVDYQIHTEHNKPYYKIIRADGTQQLFLSFISLLRNFDREDLEMMWKIVQERFESSKPKNFTDDFLLNALKTMNRYALSFNANCKPIRVILGL